MKKKIITCVSLIFILTGLGCVLFLSINSANVIYKYFKADQNKLFWGMDENKMIDLMGTPDLITKTDSESAVILHYNRRIGTSLGQSNGCDIYVNISEYKNTNQKSHTLGFIQIDLFFSGTDEKSLTEKIENSYGTINGGSTYLDEVMKEIGPDFFSSTYYLQSGLTDNLSEQTREKMLAILELNNPGSHKKLFGSLVYFDLYGNKDTIKVSVNAKNLLLKKMAES